jgi:hypothetical protein
MTFLRNFTRSHQLYATYNGKGPSMALTSVAVMLNAVGLIGLLGNAFLCWVTVQNRQANKIYFIP